MKTDVAFDRSYQIFEHLVKQAEAPSDILLLLALVAQLCGRMVDLDWKTHVPTPNVKNHQQPIETTLTQTVDNLMYCYNLLERSK